jgi:hypothetical protein
MIILEKSKALGRLIRQDDIQELATPTLALVKDAIRARKIDEALAFLDYAYSESKALHDALVSVVDDVLTHLANIKEEEVYNVLRKRYEPTIRRWLSETPGAMESLQRGIESQRGHGGNCSITEESDRYVVVCDPCGSGGQLRRTKDAAVVKKAYFWTWSRTNVPYYCIHCCIAWEILPIEMRGYPIRINLIGDKPEDPCVHFYYKKPELMPDEYFAVTGQLKKCS